MPRRIIIIYWTAWIAYILFALVYFPRFNISACIPTFPLMALGAWLFGTQKGLFIILFSIIYHFILLSLVHADIFNWHQTKATSPVIAIVIVYLFGSLKNNLDQIKETYEELDRLVQDRAVELANLTAKLLDDNECARIRRGEELHDGMGQQLTGIRLLSSSLHKQFLDEGYAAASFTDTLRNHTMKAHNQIRRVSRMLFPIRIGQVGLIPALNELAASLMEIKPIKFTVEELEELPPLPAMTSLQLYRICQETSIHAIDKLGASHVVIRIGQTRSDYLLGIEHDGVQPFANDEKGPFELIQYRLRQICGGMNLTISTGGQRLTTYHVPKTTVAL